MEIIIILIILGIIGYVVFQNQPATKFTSACRLLSEKKYNEAIAIFQSILAKHPEAPTKLATCFLEQAIILNSKNHQDFSGFQKIFDLKTTLNSNYNRGTFDTIEAKANYEIASSKYSLIKKNNTELDLIKGLNENLKFIQSSIKAGMEKKFSSLKNNHFVELGKIYFDLGTRNELKNDFINAIATYSTSIEYRSKITKNQIYYDTVTRREICKLKIGEVSDYGTMTFIFHDIDNSSFNIKKDFYFRYILESLKDNPILAEELLYKHLSDDNSEVKILKQYFWNIKRKSAKDKIIEINKNLELLFENQFPIENTKNFYETIDKVTPEIIKIFPELKVKLEEIKPSLFNKLLINSMDQLKYEVAIDLITKFPNFWEIPELLKNLGICCFGITNESKITSSNYKLIISSWLTAVYSDKVILKSLDSTSWDDEYTFTLIEAIGSKFNNHSDLPENTNYEEVSDTNISIGATQLELIQQYENLLNNKIEEESLSKKAHEFYSFQKNSIKKIVDIIPNDILFAAPFFATKFSSIATQVIEELNDDYSEYSNEEALEAGIAYLDANSSDSRIADTVSEYAEAHNVKNSFMKAIYSLDTKKLIEINKDKNKVKIVNKYDSFRETFEDEIFSHINSLIEKDDENEKLTTVIAQSVNLFNTGNKLRYQYSNFVTNLTISKVNSKQWTNYTALSNLKNAYFCKKDIARVCKNLIEVIRMNLFDIINDRTTKDNDIYALLDEIKKDKSSMYMSHCSELNKARRELLAQFPADSRALILAGTNLSGEGLKIRKAVKYLAEMGDGDDYADLSDLFPKR